MRTAKKEKDKTNIPENIPSNLLLNRLLEESCVEMMQAAEMLASHTTSFERDLLARLGKQEIIIKELKRDINDLKNRVKLR